MAEGVGGAVRVRLLLSDESISYGLLGDGPHRLAPGNGFVFNGVCRVQGRIGGAGQHQLWLPVSALGAASGREQDAS